MSSLLSTLQGKAYAVLGLGRSGLSIAKKLQKAGVKVIVWDDSEHGRMQAEQAKLALDDFSQPDDFVGIEALILSPGIPHKHPRPHPIVERAIQASVPVVSDIEILRQVDPDSNLIAVTGTNGKSTTTALIGEILKTKHGSQIGGNIGVPVMDLKKPRKGGAYVLEVSSYQLELTASLNPKVAVLLNISPDHLDRHGGMEGYIAAKSRIFTTHIEPDDIENLADIDKPLAVICIDDEPCQIMADKLRDDPRWRVITVAALTDKNADINVRAGKLMDHLGSVEIDLNENKKMRGAHNHQNAAASYAALHYGYDFSSDEFITAYNEFAGLRHRQYLVRTINGVAYVNDSKATNANASERALASYRNIYWIVGGRPKASGLEGIERWKDNIRHAFLIGESSDQFAKWMEQYNIEFDRSQTLEVAVAKAHQIAQENRGAPGGAGAVVLSPSCAAFDQFKNFEERGETFERLVEDLGEGA